MPHCYVMDTLPVLSCLKCADPALRGVTAVTPSKGHTLIDRPVSRVRTIAMGLPVRSLLDVSQYRLVSEHVCAHIFSRTFLSTKLDGSSMLKETAFFFFSNCRF